MPCAKRRGSTQLFMKTENTDLNPLGKEVVHSQSYHPDHLYPVSRAEGRNEIGLGKTLPFTGADIWNAYEISWLNKLGRPEIAIGQFVFPSDSPNLIESKSLKLYLNSLNLERFDSVAAVRTTIAKDLTDRAGRPVDVVLYQIDDYAIANTAIPPGRRLDDIEIEAQSYQLDPSTLRTLSEKAEETLYSNLLRTNCPVTGQPDWGTVVIQYQGPRIDSAGLLKYIVSYREHTGFHENCVERIFCDILVRCNPEQLFVRAQFTRRGGLDINPWRANYDIVPEFVRYVRQ